MEEKKKKNWCGASPEDKCYKKKKKKAEIKFATELYMHYY